MKKIISAFVKYPFYANLTIALFLLMGTIGLMNIKLSMFPEMTSRDIIITVAYPGASPKEMEEGVTTRIEESLRGVVGVKEITSTSSENFATVNIRTVFSANIDDVLIEVKNAVDGITSFPIDAEKPIIFKRRAVTNVGFLSLNGDVDLLTLKRLADEIENDFYNSGVMSQLTITGIPELELSVEANEEMLLRYNLSFNELMLALNQNNVDISGGIIRSDEQEILIRTRNRSVNPDEISDLVVRAGKDGHLIRVRDVAAVRLQFAEGPGESYINGTPSISFQVTKLPEEDLGEITDFLKDYAEQFNEKHEEVKLEITFSFIKNLMARLNLLLENGLFGLFLVIVILGLFLNFRISGWVAWGIPASFMAMFLVAAIAGVTINMISLFGMILIIGILVDDGIVISENIHTHFEMGKSPVRAAIDGTLEVVPSVTASILTTVVAFVPLFFIEGNMEMMKDVGFVVVVTLLISLLEAFFVLPAHLASPKILNHNPEKGFFTRLNTRVDRIMVFLREKIYGKMLLFIIQHRYLIIVIPIGLIMITLGLLRGNHIPMTFFPSIPFDQFNVDIAFKPGVGEKITDDYLKSFDAAIWEVNENLKAEFSDTTDFVQYTFRTVGTAFAGEESGSHAGNIFVYLRDLENAPVTSFDVVNRVQEKIGKVPSAEKFIVSGRNTFGDPVSVSLLGSNLEELSKAKNFLREEMAKIEALNNIKDNNVVGKQEVLITLKPLAFALGLNYSMISAQIRNGFFGGQAQRLQAGKDELRLWVRYPQEDRSTLGQLEKIKVKTNQGEYPLLSLIDYEIKRGPVSIKRYNGSREIRVTAGVKNPSEPVVPITDKIRNEIVPELLAQFPTVRVDYLGQQKESKESGQSLGRIYMIAFILIMLIIMLQFKSVSQMLMILVMIPLAFLGSVWGHGIEGIPLSMLSVWGLVALTGVIVNDAIVFLAKYNALLLEGHNVRVAVYQAGKARFRAIILTTITTVAGLYPIIFEKSFQAQFLKPLAVSLAYGVFIGTIFILIFFPAVLMVVNDVKRFGVRIWTGHKPTDLEVEPAIRLHRRDKEFESNE